MHRHPLGGPLGGPFMSGYPFAGATFSREYQVLPMDSSKDSNWGGKILLPASALQQLMSMTIEYPMMFKLTNRNASDPSTSMTPSSPRNEIATHAGVLEFTADEGTVVVPSWILAQLKLNAGGVIAVDYVKLPKATFTKFKPKSTDFVEDISDHRAILERHLRDFACLTSGDEITVYYLGKEYKIIVEETKPANAISIIDTDMNVDFAAADGQENFSSKFDQSNKGAAGSTSKAGSSSIPIKKNSPKKSKQVLQNVSVGSPLGTPEIRSKIEDHLIEKAKEDPFVKFTGKANRLDGKKKGTSSKKNVIQADFSKYSRGIPDMEWSVGELTFIRAAPSQRSKEQLNGDDEFVAFSGSGTKINAKSRSKKAR